MPDKEEKSIEKPKNVTEWLETQSTGNKIAIGIGVCCLGVFLIGLLGAIFMPEAPSIPEPTPEPVPEPPIPEPTPEPVPEPPIHEPTPEPTHKEGVVVNVVNGDTIDVEGVGRVRLAGVNTPERGQPGYVEATNFMRRMTLGRVVYLNIDDARPRDRYGRVRAVVYVDGVNLNAELLRRGYA